MQEWFASLPLAGTTAVVAFVSLLVVFALSRMLRNGWIWTAGVVAPLAIAYCAYSMSAGDSAEASAWEALFMIAWGGTGLVACLILVAVLRVRQRRLPAHRATQSDR